MNAHEELTEYLEDGEVIQGIVFGAFGWDGFGEPQPPLVPSNKRGVVLSFEEAKPYMVGWSFYGGFGHPKCYACYIWTDKRVIWVTQYDGATNLDSAPRNPINIVPDMSGG